MESTGKPVITLLTDFGLQDPYAGIMKGVILGICPEASIVDLTHEVIPYQIAQAAFLLQQSWPYFPNGSIHIVVVDPGVGTARRPILVEAGGHYFIGPDNGVFSMIENAEFQEITASGQPASHTFHGRDVFAPAAARLALGVKNCQPIKDPVLLRFAAGTVLHIDHFGNVITNLRPGPAKVRVGSEVIERQVATYADAPHGELFLIKGSSGYLEIALNQGSAAGRLGIGVGSVLTVET
jgi:S-adenosyl-L-methionine hydrolase (adenosine-forming)